MPRPPLPPEPHHPYRLSQQEWGLHECRSHIGPPGAPWVFQPNANKRLTAIWELGAWLEPAIEGLARRFPEAACLHDKVAQDATVGAEAYEGWMRLRPSHRMDVFLEFTPEPRDNDTVGHGLLLGLPGPRDITIRTTDLRTERGLGLFCLHNAYYEDINEASRETVKNGCIEAFPRADGEDPVIYSPFVPSTRTERSQLGELVYERFGPETADVYAEHDTAGLGSYRIWSALHTIFSRLAEVR